MQNETGESTASINARCDDNAWPRVLSALQSGATLFRPVRLKNYYTMCHDDLNPNNGIGISATRVRKLELAGIVIRIGVDRYALGIVPKHIEVQEYIVESQLKLF
jgi:hypothetical protein